MQQDRSVGPPPRRGRKNARKIPERWKLQEEKGVTQDEIVRWHHWLNGHEFEQAPGKNEGQWSPVCCSPLGHEKSDTTERLNNNNSYVQVMLLHTRCEVSEQPGIFFSPRVYEWLANEFSFVRYTRQVGPKGLKICLLLLYLKQLDM